MKMYKTYKVILSFGRKSAAFESTYNTVDSKTAVQLAKNLAVSCGFNDPVKKVTVQEM